MKQQMRLRKRLYKSLCQRIPQIRYLPFDRIPGIDYHERRLQKFKTIKEVPPELYQMLGKSYIETSIAESLIRDLVKENVITYDWQDSPYGKRVIAEILVGRPK